MSLRTCIDAAEDLSDGDRAFLDRELEIGSTDQAAMDNLASVIQIEMDELVAIIEGAGRTVGREGQEALTDYIETARLLPVPPQEYELTKEDKALVAKLKKEVPGFGKILRYLQPDEIASIKTARSAQNLVDYLESLPATTEMAEVAFAGRAKRGWYVNSQRAIEEIFGEDATRFTALLAALSPQLSVEGNMLNAVKVWAAWDAAGRPNDTRQIMKIMGENVQGDKGEKSVLDAWANNSMRALTHPNPESLVLSGPKVNSFMLNLRGFPNEVTSDVWMGNYVGYGEGMLNRDNKALPGKKAGYLALTIRTRQAAELLSKRTGEQWTPSEIQETVWSMARTLAEMAKVKGETRNELQILQSGELTHEVMGDTVDFEQLLIKGQYRKILAGAGYGAQLDKAAQRVKGREPSKLTGSVYKKGNAHLNRMAKRLRDLAERNRAAAVRSDIAVNLSLGQTPDQANAIPGLVNLTKAANQGDQQATRILQDTAWDALRYLMSGIKSVKLERTRAVGLYNGDYEPSIGISMSFKEEDRARVLSMLAKFGQNFNQDEVHVRGDAPARKVEGTVLDDGSYVTPVVRFNLTEPLSREEAQDIIDKSGLPGVTITDGYLEVYYAGDPNNGQEVEAFAKAYQAARTIIGGKDAGVTETRERIWKYGNRPDSTARYELIQGQFSPPREDVANLSAARVATRLAGAEVTPSVQGERITEPQTQVQTRIAEAFEDMRLNAIEDPIVKRAYDALAREVLDQFDAIPTKAETWTGKGEPYTDSKGEVSSKLMRQDVLFNNHLYFYKTDKDTFGPPGQDYSAHPLLQDSGRTDTNGQPLLFNDLLRIVHDYYAHTMSPVAFGPLGEEAAWKNHMLMTRDPWARWALTSETRGQNSWVNFREGVSDLPFRDRGFSEQKVDLLPLEFVMTGEDDLDSSLAGLPGGDSIEAPEYFAQSVFHATAAERLEGGELQTSYIGKGTGVGQTNFGWGLYVTSKPGIANLFREWLTESREGEGGIYMLNMVPNPDTEFLDWDALYKDQPPAVIAALTRLTNKPPEYFEDIPFTGADMYNMLARDLGGDKQASLAMLKAGIKGNQFRDITTEGYGEGAVNYVVFDESHVKVIDRLMQSNTFYSGLERALDKVQQKKGTGKQFLGIIRKFAKKEEMDWIGLEEFLDGDEVITLDTIKAFVHEGGVRVDEIMRLEHGAIGEFDMAAVYGPARDVIQKHDYFGFEGYKMSSAIEMIMATDNWEKKLDPNISKNLTDNDRDIIASYKSTRIEYEAVKKTKFGTDKLVVPGGVNYRELLLTLPVDTAVVKGGWGMIRVGQTTILERFDTEQEARIAARIHNDASTDPSDDVEVHKISVTEGVGEVFTDGHWDEENVMAHIRFNERTINNKRVLFIEEIQSDWHQAAREALHEDGDPVGYRLATRKKAPLKKVQARVEKQINRLESEYWDLGGLPLLTQYSTSEVEAEQAVYQKLKAIRDKQAVLSGEWNDLQEQVESREGVPDAPFKKSWPLLAMKRMIRYAAENGFDQVAWTNGDIQAQRYKLSNVINELEVGQREDGEHFYIATDVPEADQSLVKLEDLHKYIGRELADQALEQISSSPSARALRTEIEQHHITRGALTYKIGELQKKLTTLEYRIPLFEGNSVEFREALAERAELEEVFSRTNVERDQVAVTLAQARKDLQEFTVVNFDVDDLEVGGEGMKGFYDKMLPRMTSSYIKKFGATVGQIPLPVKDRKRSVDRDEDIEGPQFIDLSKEDALVLMMSGYEISGEIGGDTRTIDPDDSYIDPEAMSVGGFVTALREKYAAQIESYDEVYLDPSQATEDLVREFPDILGETLVDTPVHAFDVTDEMKESVLQGQAYFQEDAQPEERARFYPNVDGDRIIQLLSASDPSSFLHEAGHLFLDVQRVWAEKYGMTENQQAMLDYLGVADFEHIGVEQHETWAESFEVYLREGKAPSLGLRRAFASFTRWLKRIYTTLKDKRLTRAQLDPEIARIFDRLLATQEEIEIAAATPEHAQLFRTQEQSGMTDAQWAEYSKTAKRRVEDAEMTLDEKVMAEYKRLHSRQWNEEKAPLIEEERAKLEPLPIYQVQAQAREHKDEDGNVTEDKRMDWHKLKEAMGGRFPGGKWSRLAVGGGIDPKLYAEQNGFASVQDMVDQIEAEPSITQAADARAETRMKAKYGDILNGGTLEAEVREAMMNEDQAKLLLMELRAANKYQGWLSEIGQPLQGKVNRKYLKAEAEQMISGMTYKQIDPNKYYRQMIKAAQAAMTDENPAQAKINQLANHYLYKEAMRVKEQMEKHRKKVRGVQDRKFHSTKIQQEYYEAAQILARAYDMRVKPEERLELLKRTLDWYAGQVAPQPGIEEEMSGLHELLNMEMLDPNMLAAIEYRLKNKDTLEGFEMKTFNDLTATELHGVTDMLDHILYVGRQLKKMDQVEFEANRDAGAESIETNGGKNYRLQRGQQSKWRKADTVWSDLVNSMPSVVNMVRKLDGFKPGGWAFQNILVPLNEAMAKKLQTNFELVEQLQDYMGDMSAIGLRLDDKITMPTEAGEIHISSEEIFMMGMYWGTESSRQAIMDGHKLTEGEVMSLLERLTPEQLKMINATWALNESQWPDLQKAAKAMLGVAPPKLIATPFMVNGVQMTGGHMQLIYDSASTELKDEQQRGMTTGTVVPTQAGSTFQRVGSGGKMVKLLASNITQSIEEKAHYIAFAETGRHLRSLLNNPKIRDMIEQKHGPRFYTNLTLAVGGVTQAQPAQETAKGFAELSRWARGNATMMHLGFSIRNVMQQFPAALISMRVVGPGRFAAASGLFVAKRKRMVGMVNTKSKFMMNRAQLVNREAKETMKMMMATSEGRRKWNQLKSLAFILQTAVDSTIAYPTWYAQYSKSMNEHQDEARAILEADSAVAESVGSGSDMHLGRIMQSNQSEYVKTLTIFGSWFNAYYQRLYKSSRGGESFVNPAFLMDAVVMPIIVANLTQAIIFDMPDDEETWVEWGIDNTFMFMLGTIPVIRDFGSLSKGFTPTSPLGGMMAAVWRIPQEFESWMNDNQSGMKLTSDLGKATGLIVPMPGAGNVWRTLDYIDSFNKGEEEGDFNIPQMLTEGADKN